MVGGGSRDWKEANRIEVPRKEKGSKARQGTGGVGQAEKEEQKRGQAGKGEVGLKEREGSRPALRARMQEEE